jgi:hypothetical protein
VSILAIFKNPGNNGFDLARIIGASASITYPFPFIWNVISHGQVPDAASFGTGYAAVLAAIGAMICAKDIGVAKANATSAPTT